MLGEKRLQAFDVVVAELNGQISKALGNSGGHRSVADEPVIYGKKWLIGATGDQVAASVGAGQTDCAAGGVRAIFRKLDHVGVGKQAQQLLRAFHLDGGG